MSILGHFRVYNHNSQLHFAISFNFKLNNNNGSLHKVQGESSQYIIRLLQYKFCKDHVGQGNTTMCHPEQDFPLECRSVGPGT